MRNKSWKPRWPSQIRQQVERKAQQLEFLEANQRPWGQAYGTEVDELLDEVSELFDKPSGGWQQ